MAWPAWGNVNERGRRTEVRHHLHHAWRQAVICGVCLVGVGGLGLVPLAAQQQTAAVESDNPLSGDPDAIKAGRKLFNTFCTQCHGGDATGQFRSASSAPT
jgi:mono/diheme cytochrome c family protein